MSAVACILGGCCIAAFVLVHPWGQLMGAAIARTPRWQLAHTLHFVGALLASAGLIGIYLYQRERLGLFGLIGFAVAFAGNAMFVGTGMITAFIWPMLAVCAPATVELGGPIFRGPQSALAFLFTAVAIIVGYIAFGAAMLRAGVMPRFATAMLVVGAILGMSPPYPLSPIPWAALVLGGTLYGGALIWFGLILLKENSDFGLAARTQHDG
ncbi:MAG: hypothetical protein JO263_02380 [Candidatus Eremiobacteraeota bacterium]|nr:hypothetical protein [Candidatus Eremiobacteraeota bacterium]